MKKLLAMSILVAFFAGCAHYGHKSCNCGEQKASTEVACAKCKDKKDSKCETCKKGS